MAKISQESNNLELIKYKNTGIHKVRQQRHHRHQRHHHHHHQQRHQHHQSPLGEPGGRGTFKVSSGDSISQKTIPAGEE